jgi:DNA-binding NarL/FixJ family response regulator
MSIGQQEASSTRPRSPSRIVVVDDDPIYRFALGELLTPHPDLDVIAEAAGGQEAVRLCCHLRPDLVMMEVKMPKMSGIEATRKLKAESPRTVVLMLTGSEDPMHLYGALKAGALAPSTCPM